MTNTRLEAFSDGVLAIIITIMVLELHVPEGTGVAALAALWPKALTYLLSFIYLAIYWNNHHHMLKLAPQVNGSILWSNMHLLFWLSLIPVATGWLGASGLAPLPAAIYGVTLLMPALAWQVLQRAIVRHQGPDSVLRAAVGADLKGKLSVLIYAAGVALAFVAPWLAVALYVIVALMWLVPDKRFERQLREGG